MHPRLLLYPLLVLLGGCCYGILATIVKLAYDAGYSFDEVVVSQYFSGWVLLGIFCVLLAVFRRPDLASLRYRPGRRILVLLITGVVTCSVCLLYYLSLETLPASIAVVLLFQFTWIGVILDRSEEHTS